MTLCYDNWVVYLENDFNVEYLLHRVANGFRIISSDIKPPSTLCRNFKSAKTTNKKASEDQIMVELDLDCYIITESVPHVVSSLSAIEKANGSVRINDLLLLICKLGLQTNWP